MRTVAFSSWPFAVSHPPARVNAVAVVDGIDLPIARFSRRTTFRVVDRVLRPGPASMPIEVDVVAAVVVAPVPVLLQRFQHVVRVERLRADPIAARIAV